MRTALVTGGAGFLGTHLSEYLITKKKYDVIILDDLSGGFKENIPQKAKFVKGSIVNPSTIENVFDSNNIDVVYHLAAYAAEGLSPFIRRFNYRNNLIGSVNLINCSIKHDVESFVFTSSIAVYGDKDPPMTEKMTPSPEDPYGIAKYAVEMDLREAAKRFGLDYIVFRPHNVYGEYQNIGDKYRNVVGIFMNRIMSGEPMSIFGDGTQQRAFTYVKDIVPRIADSPDFPEARNRVFNVGSDRVCSVNNLAQLVAEAMGKPDHPVEHLPPRNEVKVAYSDHSESRKVFGELEPTSLEVGLENMAKWAQDVGARESSEFDVIEIEEGLPSGW